MRNNICIHISQTESDAIDMADLEFGDLLGEGGAGTVFGGLWKSKGICVALKKVKCTPEECDVKVMAELGEHPNIISFYGFTRDHPNTIIVTALAANGSLWDYLHKRHEIPSMKQTLKWAKQIANGMAYMHKLNFVHRDLKSSNILLTSDMEIQLCDFGTSRLMENTTYASKVAGTLRWMAPEVVEKKPTNKSCDVFSFAMVVWELIEQKLPFHDCPSEVVASHRIISGKRPPFIAEWPKFLSDLIQVCWSQNPRDRPHFTDIVTSLENEVYFRR